METLSENNIKTRSIGIQGFVSDLAINKTDNSIIQFIRYLFVGGMALVVDASILFILNKVFMIDALVSHAISYNVDTVVSSAISFIAGLFVNYFISTVWVFNVRKVENKVSEFLIFAGIGVIGLIFNVLIIYTCTAKFGIYVIGSKAIAAVIVYMWNYFGRKYILFNR